MAANISGLHQFADDVGPLPLKLLDDSFSTLSIALNTLSTFSNFFQDQGTTNAYTIQTTQYQFASYTDGLTVTVRIANTNTGMSTLNVNGLGAKHILTAIGTELQPNALVAGSMVTFIFNAQRDAWQISDSGASGQITAPLHITNPTGQSALSINVDGSGYLGDFTGNGLSWDGACNYTFEGGATLSGIKLPFTVMNAAGTEPQLELGADGYSGITAWPSGTAVNLEANGGGALGTPPCQLEWDANCNWIFGGDSVVNIPTLNATAGALGTAPNQITWNAAGQVTLTGTASLPMPPLIDLPGINITNPQNHDVLSYDSGTNTWVNAPAVQSLGGLTDVLLSGPNGGQALVYNGLTNRWENATLNNLLSGLNDVHLAGPASGQVLTYSVTPTPGWVNATIPGYSFLTTLSIQGTPQQGYVLTWDGNGWVGAPPGQVAAFPLSSLTDVNIVTPLNRQVLTWDAPNSRWINAPAATPSLATLPDVHLTSQTQGQVLAWDATLNRWVNSALPGGSVIALDTLMDTNISDPQNNQVLTWNYAQSRWVNQSPVTALSALTDVTLTSPASGQTLVWNGTHWVNQTPVSVTVAATAPVNPQPGWLWWDTVGGQMYVWFQSQWVIANTATSPALSQLLDVALGTPTNGQVLAYNGTTGKWANASALGNPATAQFQWDNAGHYGLGGAPTGPSRLYVWGDNAADNYAMQVYAGSGAAAGTSFGLYVQAGTNTTDQVFTLRNAAGANMLVYRGDGSGYLTPVPGAPADQSFNWSGTNPSYAFGRTVPTTSPPRVSIYQNTNGVRALDVYATGADWIANFSNQGPSSPNYGVAISAGRAATDLVLSVSTAINTAGFAVFGDATVGIGMFTSNSGATPIGLGPQRGGFYQIQQISSSRRFKEDIHTVGRAKAREVLAKLRPVKFRPKGDAPDRILYGFIAEEVAEVDSGLVNYDSEGQPIAVITDRISALLVPLLRELLGMDEPEGVY